MRFKNISLLIRQLVYSSLLLLVSTVTCAQTIDSLSSKFTRYGEKTAKPVLFVHFDKTVYTNNENVWFTAYLIGAHDQESFTTFAAELVNDNNHSIVLEDRFVIKNGLVAGNMFIPDSVAAGNYTFITYTNRLVNGNPDVSFSQAVTIKSASNPNFKALLQPVDTALNNASQKVLLMVNNAGIDALPSIPVSYYVGNTAKQVITGKAKTDKAGQYVFTIPSNLLTAGSNKLYVQVSYKGDKKELIMELPAKKQAAQVKFYPEGGNLVNNTQSTIGFEVKTVTGNPLRVNASLYQAGNAKPVQTITTDSYGLGRFNITPQANNAYYVKLNNNIKDTTYQLPSALQSGPVVSIGNAVASDTLDVELHDAVKEKLYLHFHNYRQLFYTVPVMTNTSTKKIKVLLQGIPKGLAQLTVTDSLGRPFAERVFFAHYNQRTPVSIVTDQSEYGKRKKVTVKVKLNTLIADTGLISIACVQANRIEIKKKQDIESYVYLKNDLGELPLKETYLGASSEDKEYLENVLLIKGWSKYKWLDVLKAKETNPLSQYQTPAFKGYVDLFGKPLKKPVELVLMNQRNISTIPTNNIGDFTINDAQLISVPEKKLGLAINGDDPRGYGIALYDPYTDLNKKLLENFSAQDYSNPEQTNTEYAQLAQNERIIRLKEVKIENNADGEIHPIGNECGDYVCRFHVLNCPNHRIDFVGSHPAKEGEMVFFDGSYQPYLGCGVMKAQRQGYVFEFKGIYNSREFYPDDYAISNPPQPQYISTIYWKHLSVITSVAEKEFTFYTSDIAGKFNIIVQGITNNDVVYGEKSFNVVK